MKKTSTTNDQLWGRISENKSIQISGNLDKIEIPNLISINESKWNTYHTHRRIFIWFSERLFALSVLIVSSAHPNPLYIVSLLTLRLLLRLIYKFSYNRFCSIFIVAKKVTKIVVELTFAEKTALFLYSCAKKFCTSFFAKTLSGFLRWSQCQLVHMQMRGTVSCGKGIRNDTPTSQKGVFFIMPLTLSMSIFKIKSFKITQHMSKDFKR